LLKQEKGTRNSKAVRPGLTVDGGAAHDVSLEVGGASRKVGLEAFAFGGLRLEERLRLRTIPQAGI